MTAGSGTATLELASVEKRFGERRVLADVSFTLDPGEIVALVGASGSGKSTLLSLLTGALPLDGGEIRYDGSPLPSPRPFAFMPQRDALLPWRRVVANAAIGLEVQGVSRSEARQRVTALLAPFGLADAADRYPRQLSGGMRQRVSFLRAVVQDRPILLLDEPFGALDAITRDELQRWLLDMWDVHRWSILFVTHDIREAVRLADRVIVFANRPAPIAGSVEVSRDIPRDERFLVDPRVPALEAELHALLRAQASRSNPMA
ncbi:ABC transporter ATP-binding protein [Leucobacter japonicus]|uniref:ABC transporter ATP-binding protein n=1 Tax=Leucobacter japonicus TaxID=1461259 RepID=UPI0006A78A54|nr:ABC transporter ATP-binding protein [Leucobacter japonicus]